MSLAIDVDTVTAVLLADGWHGVKHGSFTLDSYEYLWSGRDGVKIRDLSPDQDPRILHPGGRSGVSATSFVFQTLDGDMMAGPLTAILAVRYAS